MWLPAAIPARDLRRLLLEPGLVLDYGGLTAEIEPEEALKEVVRRTNRGFRHAVAKAHKDGLISEAAADHLMRTWVDPFAGAT